MTTTAWLIGSVSAGFLTLATAHLAGPAGIRLPIQARPRPPSAFRARKTWAGPALAAVVLLPVAPVLAPLGTLVVLVRRRLAVIRRARDEVVAASRDIPAALDLLALCTSAGMSLPLAHEEVAARAPGAVGVALRAAATNARAGQARADALVDALGPLGDDARAVADLLTDHLRYGTPLGPGLDRVSFEQRLAHRRRAEEAARRLPIRLLGPLVTCILPAFGLLTVVPLLAASLEALPI